MTMNDAAEQIEKQENESALQANIKQKEANSYYYAHKKKETGEEPAPMPVHVVLETTPIVAPAVQVEAISVYQFLDDGDKVKIYLPLEGIGSSEAVVSTNHTATSVEVVVEGYKPTKLLKLVVKETNGEIKVEECAVKKLKDKVIVTLVKASSSSWSKLSK
jgi:hypothetical protein